VRNVYNISDFEWVILHLPCQVECCRSYKLQATDSAMKSTAFWDLTPCSLVIHCKLRLLLYSGGGVMSQKIVSSYSLPWRSQIWGDNDVITCPDMCLPLSKECSQNIAPSLAWSLSCDTLQKHEAYSTILVFSHTDLLLLLTDKLKVLWVITFNIMTMVFTDALSMSLTK
jgi:hypothetical protein